MGHEYVNPLVEVSTSPRFGDDRVKASDGSF
jgi:hypothetical protein